MSSINNHDRKHLKKLNKQLEQGQNILLKEAERLMGIKVTNPKAEEAKKHIVEKLQGAVGRMMFVQEEVEQLLKDIPRRQNPRRRR